MIFIWIKIDMLPHTPNCLLSLLLFYWQAVTGYRNKQTNNRRNKKKSYTKMESDRKIMIIDADVWMYLSCTPCFLTVSLRRERMSVATAAAVVAFFLCSLWTMTAYCVLKTSNSFILMSNTTEKIKRRERARNVRQQIEEWWWTYRIALKFESCVHTRKHTHIFPKRYKNIDVWFFVTFSLCYEQINIYSLITS